MQWAFLRKLWATRRTWCGLLGFGLLGLGMFLALRQAAWWMELPSLEGAEFERAARELSDGERGMAGLLLAAFAAFLLERRRLQDIIRGKTPGEVAAPRKSLREFLRTVRCGYGSVWGLTCHIATVASFIGSLLVCLYWWRMTMGVPEATFPCGVAAGVMCLSTAVMMVSFFGHLLRMGRMLQKKSVARMATAAFSHRN